MAGQLAERRESLSMAAGGAHRFCFGLAKKLLLADLLSPLATEVFALPLGELSALSAWLGAAGYALQLYFDFSGYSDMAIGLAAIFGFTTRENFNYPYAARSITDFWRRWHISLSSWFRDYLYIPLGGSRRGAARQILNLCLVWALTGLWHGAAAGFALCGLYHALLLVGERFVWRRALELSPGWLRHVYTLLAVTVGWVLFRSGSADAAGAVLVAMFGGAPLLDGHGEYYLREYGALLLAGCVFALPAAPRLFALLSARRPGAALWAGRALALILLCLSYAALLSSTYNAFIYFQF